MKELDKSKKYDLSKLTNEQFNELCNEIGIVNSFIERGFLLYSEHFKHFIITMLPIGSDLKLTCATELFEPTIPTLEKFKEKCETANELLNKSIVAYKETSNKLPYELDFNFITQLAERMNANKGKYEPYNWQKLDNIEDLKQALFRHVLEVMKGNCQDDNRLFGHLEAIALNAMFINHQLNKK